MISFEVKVTVKKDLQTKERNYIENAIAKIAGELEMQVEQDGITYNRKPPYSRFDDFHTGVCFYIKLLGYEKYLDNLEYFSYFEGTKGNMHGMLAPIDDDSQRYKDFNSHIFRQKQEDAKVYILAYGKANTEDYDIDVGVFTTKGKLKAAYDELYNRKEHETLEYGYSMIDTIKIYSYHKIDELCHELYSNRYQVTLDEVDIEG